MTELVTIAIALYNNEDVVGRCIESVLQQTYTNIEVLVIDDGSSDKSFDIASGYKDSCLRVIKKENGGLSSVRQQGLNSATGTYVSFIDADDYIETTYIYNLYSQIKKNKADICVCSTLFVEDKSGKSIDGLTDAYKIKDEHGVEVNDELLAHSYYHTLCKYFMCDSWNKMYRTDFLRKSQNVFNTTKGLNGSDLAYNHKLLLHNPIICSWHKKEYIHVIYSKSAVHRKNKNLIKSVLEYIDQIILEAHNLKKYEKVKNQIASVYIAALRDVFQDLYRELSESKSKTKVIFGEILKEHKKFIANRNVEYSFKQPTKSLSIFAILLKMNNSTLLFLYFKYRAAKVLNI